MHGLDLIIYQMYVNLACKSVLNKFKAKSFNLTLELTKFIARI